MMSQLRKIIFRFSFLLTIVLFANFAHAAASYIGASNLIATNGSAPGAITPNASTVNGDLLVFYHYSRATGGNETVTLPAGFTTVFNSVTANRGLVAVGWRIRQAGDTSYTATVTNHSSGGGGETILEWIETFRGTDAINPITDYTPSLSVWTSSLNIGPVSAPSSGIVYDGDMVVVFGGRFNNITGQTTLTGNNLTWVTRTLNDTGLGANAGAVTQTGLNTSGISQTITAKTITTTGTAQAGAGRMFIIKKSPPSATLSVSPSACTILSGASTCTVPFTWNITNATSPNLYNVTTAVTYSTAASGADVAYPITFGENTVQARDGNTVLATTTATGSCASGTTWSGGICATVITPITTLGTGTDPDTITVAPSTSIRDAGSFTLSTNTGTDSVTGLSVALSTSGTPYEGLSEAKITSNDGLTTYFSPVSNPSSNTVNFSGGTSIPVASGAPVQFKIRLTPRTHVGMPVPPGAMYVLNALVNAFTSTNTHDGSDSNSNTLTIDNLSPENVPGASATPGDSQVSLNWTNPSDADFITGGSVIILRNTILVAGTPTEGATYSPGEFLGSNIVACVVASSAPSSCTDTGLTNSTPYHYRAFTKDIHGNYSATGVIPSGSPATPSATPPVTHNISSTAGPGGTIIPLGPVSVIDGGSQSYTIVPDSGFQVATLFVDGASIATSTSYTFNNVTSNHTIDATFVQSTGPTPPEGAVAPALGATRPTTITFSGFAFPDASISVLDKELRSEKLVKQSVTPETDGSFSLSFVGALQGLHSFALLVKDKEGRASQTKYFLVDTISNELTVKDILIPPTIDTLSGQVSRGGNATILGYASPNYRLNLYLDGILFEEGLAGEDGSYRINIPTGALNFGQHTVKIKQSNILNKNESDFSAVKTFIVSKLSVVKSDINGDGKVDIKDWSIFLARFTSKDSTVKSGVDFNNDGKVDIADFSIFIKTIRK